MATREVEFPPIILQSKTHGDKRSWIFANNSAVQITWRQEKLDFAKILQSRITWRKEVRLLCKYQQKNVVWNWTFRDYCAGKTNISEKN